MGNLIGALENSQKSTAIKLKTDNQQGPTV